MSKIFFLDFDEIILVHSEIIRETGGSKGLRDAGGLESALKAAENRFNYETQNLAELAPLTPIICRRRTLSWTVTSVLRRLLPNYF